MVTRNRAARTQIANGLTSRSVVPSGGTPDLAEPAKPPTKPQNSILFAVWWFLVPIIAIIIYELVTTHC